MERNCIFLNFCIHYSIDIHYIQKIIFWFEKQFNNYLFETYVPQINIENVDNYNDLLICIIF